jgi:hypothetical protein
MKNDLSNLPLSVYVFRGGHFAPAGNTTVCVGEKDRIEGLLGSDAIERLFNGFATYTNDRAKQDYLGVWGVRNASRLRRLLRECGAELVIHPTAPPDARLRYYKTLKGYKIFPR